MSLFSRTFAPVSQQNTRTLGKRTHDAVMTTVVSGAATATGGIAGQRTGASAATAARGETEQPTAQACAPGESTAGPEVDGGRALSIPVSTPQVPALTATVNPIPARAHEPQIEAPSIRSRSPPLSPDSAAIGPGTTGAAVSGTPSAVGGETAGAATASQAPTRGGKVCAGKNTPGRYLGCSSFYSLAFEYRNSCIT